MRHARIVRLAVGFLGAVAPVWSLGGNVTAQEELRQDPEQIGVPGQSEAESEVSFEWFVGVQFICGVARRTIGDDS